MDILQKLDIADEFETHLIGSGVSNAIAPEVSITSATTGYVNNREVILAGTNNYLGLTFSKLCIEGSIDAAKRFGTGTTGSRLANGSYHNHVSLEEDISSLLRTKSTIVFTTGYVANLGVISTLVGQGDNIVLDADCHASIYEAAKLSGATIYRFKHNDVNDLDKKLSRLKAQIKQTLVITESMYSMLGDFSPLESICDVVQNHGAYLLLDEAHTFGIMGREGAGYADSLGLLKRVDFITGTFSKSLGSIGGFFTSRKYNISSLRTQIKAYMFTASNAPSVIGSTRAAMRIVRNGDGLRKMLWNNSKKVHSALTAKGFDLGAAPSPVIAAIMPDAETAGKLWNLLYENGVYVNLVVPPGAPRNLSLLRCSLSAAHTDQQIEKIITAYEKLPSTSLERSRVA